MVAGFARIQTGGSRIRLSSAARRPTLAASVAVLTRATDESTLSREMTSAYNGSVDYSVWLNRVIGWDAVLPLVVSYGSLLIARYLQKQPPADILALVGLPTLAFTVRLLVGRVQINHNTCGPLFRMLQFVALLIALVVLAFVDFFVALGAFVGNNGPQIPPAPLWTVTLVVYVTLVALAMYPGRTLS